jgi:hypothetical protein
MYKFFVFSKQTVYVRQLTPQFRVVSNDIVLRNVFVPSAQLQTATASCLQLYKAAVRNIESVVP